MYPQASVLIVFVISVCVLFLYVGNFWKTISRGIAKCLTFWRTTWNWKGLSCNRNPYVTSDIYNFHPNEKVVRFYKFGRPAIMIRDPTLAKQICVDDFQTFSHHSATFNKTINVLWNNNLYAIQSLRKWKALRNTLYPNFNQSSLGLMCQNINTCCKKYVRHLLSSGEEEIFLDMKEFAMKYVVDVIGSSAFGKDPDNLKEENTAFISAAKKVAALGAFNEINQRVSDYLQKIIIHSVRRRQTDPLYERNDQIQLMVRAQSREYAFYENNMSTQDRWASVKSSRERFRINDDVIVAQGLTSLTAGFEPVLRTICYMSWELANNVEIQKKLIQEIDKHVSKYTEFTPGVLSKFKYMDVVIQETLRKWPPYPCLDRVCTKDIVIETESGGPSITVTKGTIVEIPVHEIQRDPKHYAKPNFFDPERYYNVKKKEYMTQLNSEKFLGYGRGPRNCMGARFANVKIKLWFIHLLRKFNMIAPYETSSMNQVDKNSFALGTEDKLWVGLQRRRY